MALIWDWDDILGEVIVERTHGDEVMRFKNVLYKGNAFVIFLCHYMQDGEAYYNMHNFACDKEHAKRMLGLDKKYKQTYGTNEWDQGHDRYVAFTLDSKRKEAREFAKLLMDATWRKDITINLVDYKPSDNYAAESFDV